MCHDIYLVSFWYLIISNRVVEELIFQSWIRWNAWREENCCKNLFKEKRKHRLIRKKILFLSSFELIIRKNIDFRLIHFLTRIFYFFIFAFSKVSSNYVSIYLYYFFLCNTIILLHFVQQSMQQKYMKLEEILLLEYI